MQSARRSHEPYSPPWQPAFGMGAGTRMPERVACGQEAPWLKKSAGAAAWLGCAGGGLRRGKGREPGEESGHTSGR